MPLEQIYRGRRAATIENEHIRATVLVEGGHIAELLDKQSGVNPLWTPPWPSIEPSAYDPLLHRDAYGSGSDAKLLAGIMGHNVCLDIFGGPSADEATAGLTAHGDAPVAVYDIVNIAGAERGLLMHTHLPLAQIDFERRVELHERTLDVFERVESLCAFDRPIGWTEHVTLGPPFLEKDVTEFRASATRSQVIDAPFGANDYLKRGAVFEWPQAPRADHGVVDLQRFTSATRSSAYTAHLMSARGDAAFFVAFSPALHLALGYTWRAADFPWMGIWEENRSRTAAPWNGRTLTRGMEFGVSPFPESRRAMVERGRLFDTPTCRWLPAHGVLEAAYSIVIQHAASIPECLDRPFEWSAS